MTELTHLDERGRARMVDVSAKNETVRGATARGRVLMRPATLALIREGAIGKGDVLAVAQVAGVIGAKRTSDLIPLCHPLPITGVELDFTLDEAASAVEISATARVVGKTGVEMEALAAVSVAALTVYDMCKAVDKDMVIDRVRLVHKIGGRSGEYLRADDSAQRMDLMDNRAHRDEPQTHEHAVARITVGIITVSDKASRGEREDRGGGTIREIVEASGATVGAYTVVPDERDQIAARICEMADDRDFDVIFTTGGTGLSPRDVTPEATLSVIDYQVPGLAEAMRAESFKKTPAGILSRAVAGVRKRTLVVNLPGNPKGVQECLDVIMPAVPHAVSVIRGEVGEHNRPTP